MALQPLSEILKACELSFDNCRFEAGDHVEWSRDRGRGIQGRVVDSREGQVLVLFHQSGPWHGTQKWLPAEVLRRVE